MRLHWPLDLVVIHFRKVHLRRVVRNYCEPTSRQSDQGHEVAHVNVWRVHVQIPKAGHVGDG